MERRPLRLETLKRRIRWKGGPKRVSRDTVYKGTLETALNWMWKGKHKQAGRNMPGTQPRRAVASHNGQGWILPP